jgi:hypothetical protein
MFEREIQFIYDFNQNKVKKLGSFITYDQLQNSDIHPAILSYISGEIEYLIFEDRQKLLKDSLFDYSGDTINTHFSHISDEIKRSKRFSLNYIEKLILHAASFTINFLVRPNWSLLKFLFDEEKNKSTLEIKQIFNYFYYYPYLKKIVISYLDKKKVVTLSYDEFKSLLKKIDRLGLESNYHNILDEALDSMGEFFNIGVSKRRFVPVKAVSMFLEEKSLDPFLIKLNEVFTNTETSRYDVEEYKNIMRDVIYESDESLESSEAEFDYPKDEKYDDLNRIDTFGESIKEKHIEEEPSEVLAEEIYAEVIGEPDKIEIEGKNPSFGDMDGEEIDEIDIDEDATAVNESVDELAEFVKEEKELEQIHKEADTLISQNIGDSFKENTDEIQSDFLENNAPEVSPKLNESFSESVTEAQKELDEALEQNKNAQLDIVEEDSISEEDIKLEDLLSEDEENIEFMDNDIEEPEEQKEVTESLDFNSILIEQENIVVLDEDEEIKEVNSDNVFIFDEVEKELELFNETDLSEYYTPENITDKEDAPVNVNESSNDKKNENKSVLIDLTELLGNKKMNKIIDTIFDYDMEEFATAIEKITEASDKNEAMQIVEDICNSAQVSPTSKEAKTFKTIISEYFDQV